MERDEKAKEGKEKVEWRRVKGRRKKNSWKEEKKIFKEKK